MAIGALPVRSCSPQYFGPKNTGEDCELADKKKNDNRVVHDLLLYRPAAGVNVGVAIGVIVPVPRDAAAQNCSQSTIEQQVTRRFPPPWSSRKRGRPACANNDQEGISDTHARQIQRLDLWGGVAVPLPSGGISSEAASSSTFGGPARGVAGIGFQPG